MMKMSGDPATADKVNFDQLIDEHGNSVGVPPTVIRSDEEVAAMRQQRAQAQQAQQQAELAESATKSVKNLANSSLEDKNALSAIAAGMQQ
jgi:hypothetical protein